MRGTLIRTHLDWVRQHRDREEVIEFFESLQPSLRNVVESSWYPFEDLLSLQRAIAGHFADGHVRLLEEIGAYGARHALSRESLLNASSIHEFLGSFVHLRADMLDFGRARYHVVDEHDGRMIHHDESSYSPLCCAMSAGFYRESIELHGGGNAQVWESQCQCRGDSTCTFELLWN